MSFTQRLAAFALAACAGCAATGVTLRSNHYRVYVPAGWQVVEAGGDGVLPTLLRIPARAEGDPPMIELRLYPWVVQGPLADPPQEALQRLTSGGAIVPRSSEGAIQPCADRNEGFIIFGEAVRAIHLEDTAGSAHVLTAGYAYGSLVAIIASTPPGRPLCAAVGGMHAAIKQLTAHLAPNGDLTRPVVPPTVTGEKGLSVPIAPVDPGQLIP